MTFKSFKQHLVESKDTVYFTFGRMNPPTVGHQKLLDKLSKEAGGNPYRVFVSQSHDPKKNPLSYSDKVKHIRKMFPRHARSVLINKKVRTVFHAADLLFEQGFTQLVMVVGSDRVTEFKTLLNKYNGKQRNDGFYNFKSINVVSAGARDPDAEGVEGMSASKMRAAAESEDFASFSSGVPKSLSTRDAKKLYTDVRRGMGLKEHTTFKNHIELTPVSEKREQYVEGNLFELGDTVNIISEDTPAKITWLGTNYIIVERNDGTTARKWIDDVEAIELDEDWIDPKLKQFFDRLLNGKKYQVAIQHAMKIRNQNPKRDGQWVLVQAAKHTNLDYRSLKKVYNQAVKKEVVPQFAEATDAVELAQQQIDAEKETDKIRFKRMLDRAKLKNRASASANRTTKPENK